jgi:hypothetical protein
LDGKKEDLDMGNLGNGGTTKTHKVTHSHTDEDEEEGRI